MFSSKNKYRIKSIEKSALGCFTLDGKGRFLQTNKTLLEILKIQDKTVIGKTLTDIFPSELKKEIVNALSSALEGNEIRLSIDYLPTKNSYPSLILILRPIQSDLARIDGIIEDVSSKKTTDLALKESEKNFRSLIERTNDGICIIQDSIIKYVNPPLTIIVGKDVDELVGHNFEEFIAPSEVQKIIDRYSKRMAGHSIPPIYETAILHKNGKIIPVEFNAGISYYQGKPADFVFIRDITKRKENEKALRNAKRELSTLISNLPGMAYSCKNDKDWTMELISDGCLPLTGYPASDFIDNKNLSYNDAIHPDDRDFVWDSIQKALQMSKPFMFEYRIISANGREKWVWEQGRGVSGDNGKIHLEGFITDINERIETEKALRKSEQRYRNLFENSVLGIYRTTPEGKILLANAALIKMLGYDSPDSFFKSNLEQSRFYDPNSPRSLFKQKIESSGRVNGMESVWVDKFGKKVFIRESARLVRGPDGKIKYYEGTVEDITSVKIARKKQLESEAKYKALFEQASDIVFIEDIDGTIIDVNERAFEIIGYNREELIAENISKIVPQEEAAKLVVHFNNLKKDLGFRVESYNRHKDGRLIPVEVNIMPVKVNEENLIIAFVRDISEKRRLEEQLRLSQKMEALGRLAGGIAHDFNNLLTGIFGYVDLLKLSMPKSDSNYESVENIENVATRAASLTRQLLAFSKKQVLVPELLSINEVISEMTGMLSRIIGEKIDFTFSPGSDLLAVKVDRSQLEQVLMNLVINAGDAMPEGGKLTVETKLIEFDKEYVETHANASYGKHIMLSVSDTGCGIDTEKLAKIFEPFFTTKGNGIGTGLGLPTVYGIVKQSGGHVYVYSELNKGSVFKVYFPATQLDNTLPEIEEDAVFYNGDETILVVDDDDDVRKAIVNALSFNGYKVLQAADGREALEIVEKLEKPLHLIITDIVMPKLGGRDLVEIIRDIFPAIKIIYISGYTDKTVMEPNLPSAAGEFIQKPFSANTLIKKVREILDS
ncbi:PAS domain S-box protein [bacterium]|nr:PAS domain S-box protein [bacterium]